MRKLLPVLILFIALQAFAQPKMGYDDKIRIREAMTISNTFGDKIWKGINDVPFVILLVTDSIEFLVNHPYPSDDFKISEYDAITGAKIHYRTRQFQPWFLATFPAVSGVNCIVVGTPENTKKNSTDWTITLLHEHFHQYQFSSKDYYKEVNALGLSGGDETGMWQINYKFSYDSAIVVAQYKKYTTALAKALESINTSSFAKAFAAYKTERNKFKAVLNSNDYNYFSFQIWQEGIARYTEYKFIEALTGYKPSNEFFMLSDKTPFYIYSQNFYKAQAKELTALDLAKDQRLCFYAIGFAEGLLLDQQNKNWKENYLKEKFFIEGYSEKWK